MPGTSTTPRARRRPVAKANETKKKYNFYLPTQIVDRLHESADGNRRGIGAELTVILERYFAASEQAGKVA